MEEKLNKTDLDDAKRSQQEEIRDELFKVRDRVVQAIKGQPLLLAGGILAFGILYRLVFGSLRRNSALPEDDSQLWVDAYIDTIVDDARYAVTRGAEAGDAVREALQDRVPLIIYSPGEKKVQPGLIRQMLELAVTTSIGFGIRAGLERLTSRFERVATELERQTDASTGSEGIASAVSG